MFRTGRRDWDDVAVDSLTLVRLGTFSGAAVSLRDAMARRVPTTDVDVRRYARDPRLLPSRAGAMISGRLGRPRVDWTRTPAWPAALQRRLERDGVLAPPGPVLFAATWLALNPDPSLDYWIYTDRPALEGARGDPRFTTASRAGWLAREAEFVRRARGVFLTGRSSVEVLVDDYGVAADRIQVVGAAPNAPLQPGEFRTECRRLLFVGIDWVRKGGPDLLEAFALARSRHPELELEIVGCEPDDPLPEGVILSGRIPHSEMGPVFARADALLLPSYHEATPFVIFEALMQGIPVVATTVANMPDMVADGGVCVAPGRPDELAAAIEEVVTDHPAVRARAVARGRELARTHNWSVIADRMLASMGFPRAARDDPA
jgi:glycosyltransferase involved in cell wall biosynthesis